MARIKEFRGSPLRLQGDSLHFRTLTAEMMAVGPGEGLQMVVDNRGIYARTVHRREIAAWRS